MLFVAPVVAVAAAPQTLVRVLPVAVPRGRQTVVVLLLLVPTGGAAFGVVVTPELPQAETMTATAATAHAIPNRPPTARTLSSSPESRPTSVSSPTLAAVLSPLVAWK